VACSIPGDQNQIVIGGMPLINLVYVMIAMMMMDAALDPFNKPHRSSTRLGTRTIKRQRKSVHQVFNDIGPTKVKQAYRMTAISFWKLYRMIKPFMKETDDTSRKRKRGKYPTAPNGIIPVSIRLAVTLQYLAGGMVYDIAPLYGIGCSDVHRSVDMVVDAINKCTELKIEFPSSWKEQREIANGFQEKSAASIPNCCGAIDGIMIWISKPSYIDCESLGFQDGKFYCARKNKYGLNMMATCDSKGRFLDVQISHPGSTSDHLCFITSSLKCKLESKRPGTGEDFLAPGLCLFGDNAYVNTNFLASPYANVQLTKAQDSYNFYHSQLRVRIECAFGMLVRRFGLLRRQMHPRIPIYKVTAMVMAMCRIHNFCINERESSLVELSDKKVIGR
jgi:hypothetical protein